MNHMNGIRTDLAVEIRDHLQGKLGENGEIPGVELKQETAPGSQIRVSTVIIRNNEGKKAMGKPIGTYITIEAGDLATSENDAREQAASVISTYLQQLSLQISKTLQPLSAKPSEAPQHRSGKAGETPQPLFRKPSGTPQHRSGKAGETPGGILVVGLGNREITPDALGPMVVDHLLITRHVFEEYQRMFPEINDPIPVSALAPGVMGQTGMETTEILKGVVRETKPKLVLVIDALAARDTGRLNRTVQMTDTGISPGAGVGNYRNEINHAVLGVPVIAIGVPTVIDEATIVRDRMEHALQENGLTEAEIAQFLTLLHEDTDRMFVTPKDIDEAIRRISEILADGINTAFSHD